MKVLSLFFFSQRIASITARPHHHRQNNQSCEIDGDCRSDHCAPVCNSSHQMCIESRAFYTRHNLEIPRCIEGGKIQKKNVGDTFGRLLGETCHNQYNCLSRHCVEECGTTEWRCIEPKIYYNRNNLDVPKCIDKKKLKVLNQLRVPTASRNIGESCTVHTNCVTGNCVHLCDDSSVARCIEPRWSFKMYGLETPKCIERDVISDYVPETAKDLYREASDKFHGGQKVEQLETGVKADDTKLVRGAPVRK